MVTVTLPDGKTLNLKDGATVADAAAEIGAGLAKAAVVGEVDGTVVDLDHVITKDSSLKIFTLKDKEGLDALRHSVAHLLAAAVLKLYPKTKLTIGPPIEHGFYYDFLFESPVSDADLPKIEEKMREILPTWDAFARSDKSITDAKDNLKNNEFKTELVDEFAKDADTVSFYTSGEFTDLCRGGHVPSMKLVKPDAFKLTHTAGAYWRGNEKNQQLTRIYGVAFPSKKELKKHLELLEQARKHDHRKLGQQLDLFSFHDVSPGSPFFHPKGAYMFIALQNFLRELYVDWGYQEVITPLIYDSELWKTSGHWDHFQEHMFTVDMDGRKAALKPMNCPSHILIFKAKSQSYRDLPFRITDFAPLHRNELRGTLGGLMRVRKFSQDDCHVFCTPEQVEDEISSHIQHVQYFYQVFGFEFHVELSTKPDKAMGDPKLWHEAETSLETALKKNNVSYTINPGDGAFYGPKIDFHIKDALGRSWQCGTEQLDFQQPERFKVQYEGNDSKKHTAVMLHRTVLGSLERFIGILIEHFAGKFPLWLAPEQVRVVTVSQNFNEYAQSVVDELLKKNIRAVLDGRAESIPKKVREAQLQYVPLIVTIGEKEQENKTLAVRTLDGKVKFGMSMEGFSKQVLDTINSKKLKIEIK